MLQFTVKNYMHIFIVISIAVILGEWDKKHDPDCDEGFCADRIKKIPIETYIYTKRYGPLKRHDILLLKLIRSIIITGK